MAEYTPTTDQVRKNWAYSKAGDLVHRTQDHLDEFDRWLAEVRREAAEKAWDEAVREAARAANEVSSLSSDVRDHLASSNPYRKEQS